MVKNFLLFGFICLLVKIASPGTIETRIYQDVSPPKTTNSAAYHFGEGMAAIPSG